MYKIKSVSERSDLHVELINRCIEHCGGNQSELARRISNGTLQTHVYHWRKGLKLVSPQFSLFIEAALGPDVIRREEFWPELFEGMERSVKIKRKRVRPVNKLRANARAAA